MIPVIILNRENIQKIAQAPEDKLLLAKVFDKINAGIRRNIVASTGFLTPRELQLCRYLFGDTDGLVQFGGYEDAERKMLIYLPDYLDQEFLYGDDSPIACLRAQFYETETPSHRDFLGALMGSGITRESVGDICIHDGFCDLIVTAQIAPYLLQNFTSAGRTSLKLQQIPLRQLQPPVQDVTEIKDTLPSLRLDCVVSAGFRMGRAAAAQSIEAGKVTIDGLPCEKTDKTVPEGAKISLRGAGKIRLVSASGLTKKNRIPVIIHRYM